MKWPQQYPSRSFHVIKHDTSHRIIIVFPRVRSLTGIGRENLLILLDVCIKVLCLQDAILNVWDSYLRAPLSTHSFPFHQQGNRSLTYVRANYFFGLKMAQLSVFLVKHISADINVLLYGYYIDLNFSESHQTSKYLLILQRM